MNDLSGPSQALAPTPTSLAQVLEAESFVFLPGAIFRGLLSEVGPLSDWDRFAASWNALEIDSHMADQGRYRRRRHAVFEIDAKGALRLLEHRPHYQSRDYNALNGGIERWFARLTPETLASESLNTVLRFCARVFATRPRPGGRRHIEVHQFRIEARAGQPGLPTPEGMHRDGVDHVLVLMIQRVNIASGTTTIHSIDERLLKSFTLTDPFDAALVDDRKVYHGVTAVEPIDALQSAYRDVLVVTFRALDPGP
ncbi:MAG: 2OG-Fe dioxygenase family protein [Burkholderiaceae bacterium]|jgi:hypothetical protein